MKYKTMKLIQTLEYPVNGYWSGGKKQTFQWSLHDRILPGETWCRVGSWDANCFFPVKQGANEKQTLGNARRSLAMRARKQNVKCSFRYEYNAF